MVLELIIAATLVVSLISLIGVLALNLRERLLNTFIFFAVSLSAGALLGGAFFDVLPEAVASLGSVESVFAYTLFGIMSFFVLEKLISWHHHHSSHKKSDIKPVGYLNLAGDGLHNFFDGVAIAASFLAGPEVGIATTIVIMLHEIPQELGDFGLLIYSGFSRRKAILFNLLSGLIAVAGGVLFYYFSSSIENLEGIGLAFTAGTFIYMATADLVPELHKETNPRKSMQQLAIVLLGIALIWLAVSVLE